ncbi:FAD/NAD-binding domain-containing protein [Sanghuangporus baumii]|uniref:FAD/NAD-binding domain-containing protein n=1 Tax=Sanghuangporus baumii TaxID=108892 RepID=A0A9Q5NCK2_SANBA|nr:FAD/NAD-binding domain-containing protein [Sanghuangporus baumii]
MLKDPELRGLVVERSPTSWVRKNTQLVGYPISSGKPHNLVFVYSDSGTQTCVMKDDIGELRNQYVDFETRVQKLLSLVESPIRWKLMDRRPLKSWVHPCGRVVLLRDDCHPMLVLRWQLKMPQSWGTSFPLYLLFPNCRHCCMYVYERLRQSRATETQLGSRAIQKMYHLPVDEQKQCDDEDSKTCRQVAGFLSSEAENNANRTITDKGSNGTGLHMPPRSKFAEWFSYDADAVVDSWWAGEG